MSVEAHYRGDAFHPRNYEQPGGNFAHLVPELYSNRPAPVSREARDSVINADGTLNFGDTLGSLYGQSLADSGHNQRKTTAAAGDHDHIHALTFDPVNEGSSFRHGDDRAETHKHEAVEKAPSDELSPEQKFATFWRDYFDALATTLKEAGSFLNPSFAKDFWDAFWQNLQRDFGGSGGASPGGGTDGRGGGDRNDGCCCPGGGQRPGGGDSGGDTSDRVVDTADNHGDGIPLATKEQVDQAMSRVRFADGGVSQQFVDKVRDALEKQPKAFLDSFLKDPNSRIILAPRGNGVGGTFDSAGRITLYEDSQRYISPEQLVSAEFVHFWDLGTPNSPGSHFSSSTVLRDAYRRAKQSGLSTGDNSLANPIEFMMAIARHLDGNTNSRIEQLFASGGMENAERALADLLRRA